MSNRRDVLLGIGAGIGVTALALGTATRRAASGYPLDYGFATTGAPLEGVAGQPLRCTAGTLTIWQGEGPFYSPKTPERRDIRDPHIREALVLAGRVLDPQCRPIAGAVLDFWQTGHEGRYDNQGYRYRGHQRTDESGRFELVTVRPSTYVAMDIFTTAHIHVKVQGASTRLLTTQIYLPDLTETNARDGGYDPALAIQYVSREPGTEHAVFDFVLENA
jgi:protocatechuate 3,4-dioxygenase beta subunit